MVLKEDFKGTGFSNSFQEVEQNSKGGTKVRGFRVSGRGEPKFWAQSAEHFVESRARTDGPRGSSKPITTRTHPHTHQPTFSSSPPSSSSLPLLVKLGFGKVLFSPVEVVRFLRGTSPAAGCRLGLREACRGEGGVWYWHMDTRVSCYDLPPLPSG